MKDAGRLTAGSLDPLSPLSPAGFSPLKFPTMPSRSRQKVFACKDTSRFLCERLIVVADVSAHTKRHLSGGRRGKKGERGWVTILHPGWSAPTCGKTQYLHFAIRTTFFSLYFPEHRLHTSLLRGMPQWDCWALMACTCLSATECKHREKPLDMLLRLPFVSESAATAAYPGVSFFFFFRRSIF